MRFRIAAFSSFIFRSRDREEKLAIAVEFVRSFLLQQAILARISTSSALMPTIKTLVPIHFLAWQTTRRRKPDANSPIHRINHQLLTSPTPVSLISTPDSRSSQVGSPFECPNRSLTDRRPRLGRVPIRSFLRHPRRASQTLSTNAAHRWVGGIGSPVSR
jgi:hypothetical protein